MKRQIKLKLKKKCLSNENSFLIYNLAEEEVRKLNIDESLIKNDNQIMDNKINMSIKNKLERKLSKKLGTYFKNQNNNENPQLEIPTMNSVTSNAYNGLNEESISMANISPSIERLQSLIPDINEKMTIKNSFNIYTPPNLYKLNYEKYLKSMLKELNQREKEAKKNKEKLENEIKIIEQDITNKRLNIELIRNVTFQNNVKQRMINQYEKEFKEEINKEMLKNIKNKEKQIDKKELFSMENKYKDANEIKEQYEEEVKKEIEKQINVKSLLTEKTFKSKLNNILIGNQLLSHSKSEQFRKDIKKLVEKKKILWEDINLYHEKLKNIRDIQKRLKDKLYIYYLSILQEGTDTRDEGLAWVISEILNLGKKVYISKMPKYLDEKCILYLFLKAHLILKIKYIEKRINETKEEFLEEQKFKKKIKRKSQNIIESKEFNNYKENLFCNFSDISNKLFSSKEEDKNILTSNTSNRYRLSRIFMEESKKKLIKSSSMFINVDSNKNANDGKLNLFPNNHKYTNLKKLFLKHNKITFEEFTSLKEEIEKLKKLKEILKEKEMKRIFYEFHRNKYCERFRVDKDVVLSALIGVENISNESFNQNKKEKELNEQLIKTRLCRKNYPVKNTMILNYSANCLIGNNSFRTENKNIKSFYNCAINYC